MWAEENIMGWNKKVVSVTLIVPQAQVGPGVWGLCHGFENTLYLKGMPCTQCARSAKFWMSANTRTLVLAPFHKFLVPCQGFCGFPST